MFEWKLAYRFDNGQIEGFKGIGTNEESALNDCFRQIKKKLEIVKESYNGKNILNDFTGLSEQQIKDIKTDWKSNLRY